jgi:uncharacterized membrane protein YedE/YeeE
MGAVGVPLGSEMRDVLLHRPAWYLAGPLLGLLVVGMLALINERLGVLGGYADVVSRLGRRSLAFGWQGCFVLGIVAGGLVFATLAGSWRAGDEYGWLTANLDDDVAVGAVLVTAGLLIGLGARTAGGCTSGNGLSGCSFGSAASFVATGTFMAVAVGTSFLTRLVVG